MPQVATVGDVAATCGLEQLKPMLDKMSLYAAYLRLEQDNRVELLWELAEAGVTKLPDRQKIANTMNKALRTLGTKEAHAESLGKVLQLPGQVGPPILEATGGGTANSPIDVSDSSSVTVKRVLITPRWGASIDDDWYKWLAEQLKGVPELAGAAVELIDLPVNKYNPTVQGCIETFGAALDKGDPSSTMVISHSLSCQAWLHVLAARPSRKRLARFLCMAGWWTLDEPIATMLPWMDPFSSRLALLKTVSPMKTKVLLGGSDDLTSDQAANAKLWKDRLGADVTVVQGANHWAKREKEDWTVCAPALDAVKELVKGLAVGGGGGGSGGSLAAPAVAAPKPWDSTPAAQRNVAILFPGQGTQKVGMAKTLLDHPSAKALFSTAKTILGYDLAELIMKGPQEKLDQTLYSQPAVFVCSLAAMEIHKAKDPQMLKKVKSAAGFSLGEYSALCFAGAISFEDGLRVVKARAEAMDAAAKVAVSGMASIGGIDDDKLEKALKDASAEKGNGTGKAYIANYMFPGGRTCSGDKQVLERVCELVKAAGANNAKMLNVSGAFHTPYMEKAADAVSKVLDAAAISMPSAQVYSNVTGKAYTSVDEIKTLLKRQLCEPVKWEQGVKVLIGAGHEGETPPPLYRRCRYRRRRHCRRRTSP